MTQQSTYTVYVTLGNSICDWILDKFQKSGVIYCVKEIKDIDVQNDMLWLFSIVRDDDGVEIEWIQLTEELGLE
jgi:hypothetical protein